MRASSSLARVGDSSSCCRRCSTSSGQRSPAISRRSSARAGLAVIGVLDQDLAPRGHRGRANRRAASPRARRCGRATCGARPARRSTPRAAAAPRAGPRSHACRRAGGPGPRGGLARLSSWGQPRRRPAAAGRRRSRHRRRLAVVEVAGQIGEQRDAGGAVLGRDPAARAAAMAAVASGQRPSTPASRGTAPRARSSAGRCTSAASQWPSAAPASASSSSASSALRTVRSNVRSSSAVGARRVQLHREHAGQVGAALLALVESARACAPPGPAAPAR
jgi:hypothetical protein